MSHLHHRSVSFKSQGIPLMRLKTVDSTGSLSMHSSPLSRQSFGSMDPMVDHSPSASATDFQTVPIIVDESGISASAADNKNYHPHSMTSDTTYNPDRERIAFEAGPLTPRQNVLTHLKGEVDPEQSTGPLMAYCFMTGFIDSVSFSAIYVWCGFQTGNGTQLAMAIARLFEGPPGQRDRTFHNPDQLALTSLIAFAIGASLGRIGDKMGSKTRAWLMLGTFLQSLFTMSAALTIWKSHSKSFANDRGDAVWTNFLSFVTVAFMSLSLGLQGIMGKRLNTQFTTTIVLTTTWCELMVDPHLFRRRYCPSRDHKIMAIATLFFGGFVGRCLIDRLGASGTLGVGCGLRFLIAMSWYWVPGKRSKP